MAFLTADEIGNRSYDVLIVGSGAAGGQTAYTLALEGIKVLLLEAGRNYTATAETAMFQTPELAPLRAAGTPDKKWGFYDATVGGGWEVPGEPYTSASDDPARQFMWWRPRMLGGRTNHWGRIALRNGPHDFKPYSRDGLGYDWPISYEEVEPYYERVERLIGVYGTNEGYENTPSSGPGVLMKAPPARVGELLVQKHARALGVPFIAIHRAVMTERLDARRLPALLHPGNATAQRILAADMPLRAACIWATPCGRGCSIRANYQSTTVHLPPALASGNLDIVCDAMVREVIVGADGKAQGVRFIDKIKGADREARARVIVLAAGACETVRLLLNSGRSGGGGLANSSGAVGHNIMDTVGSDLGGQVPRLESLPPHNEDGAGGEHLYAPWWLYGEKHVSRLGFARGYHIELGTGRQAPEIGIGNGLERLTGGSYGARLKADMRRLYGSFVYFSGRGEMIPNENCYCELDPTVKDRFGIPVLRFHWLWSEHETRQAAHMQQTFGAIVDAMGGRALAEPQTDGSKAILKGGQIIHEVGGAIMGANPKTSVTDSFGRTWEVPNLFLTDGATFCSNADKNPTLTIMALAWRSADHIATLMRRREI